MIGVPLIKVENIRQEMDFEILSMLWVWWLGDVY